MQFIIVSVIAAIIGTGGMTLFLWAVNRTGKVNADMVRALGSAVTRSYERSVWPGIFIHFGAGIPIAMLYIYGLSLLNLQAASTIIQAGGIIGFWHGFAFSFVMVILSEHHPVERFKAAGFQVAVVHFVAHIIFGLLVGSVVVLSGIPL